MFNEGVRLQGKYSLGNVQIDTLYGAFFESGIKTHEDFLNISKLAIKENGPTDESYFGEFCAFKQDENYPTLLEKVYRNGAILKIGATNEDDDNIIKIGYFLVPPKESK